MEGNVINFAQGDIDDCTWLQLSKIQNCVLIPEKEQSEVLKDFQNQKHHHRLLKLNKANLIFFYIGNKIFFLNKSNLSSIFKKNFKSSYENYHYWEFESEIKFIRIIDLKYPVPRDDISLEELDNIYIERFIMIILEKKYILIESDKFVCLLENLNNNPNPNFSAESYFLNNSVILNINSDLNTDNFTIFEDNQPGNRNDSYHFFFTNYPKDLNKDLMYLSEIYVKNLIPTLKYFRIDKAIFKSDSAFNLKKISSSSLKIIDYEIKAFSLEHIESNLICLDVAESLNFFKLQFFDNQAPKLSAASIQNQNTSIINLKKIAFEDQNPDEEIFDISLLKKTRSNCIFVSGFEYHKSSESPNKDAINTNFFIQYTYDNLNGILNDLKINFFLDTYYPDDVYNFESKPVMEAIHLNYQDEILILANSQDKQLESFAFFDEIDTIEIKHAVLEDEYKFCLPVFEAENDQYSKNAVPIGITCIDFLFDGYDKEKYLINSDEVYAPYLVLVLDNYGRLFFGYIINKHLCENPLKKDETGLILKGSFKAPVLSEQISKSETDIQNQPSLPSVKTQAKPFFSLFGNSSAFSANQSNGEPFNFSFGEVSFGKNKVNQQNVINPLLADGLNLNNKEKKESENKFKGIFLKDNKPKEEEEQQRKQQTNLINIKQNELPKAAEKKIDININNQSNENLIKLDILNKPKNKKEEKEEAQEYENIISLDNKQTKHNNKPEQTNLNTQIKPNIQNLPAKSKPAQAQSQQAAAEEENSSGSDSENVLTTSSKLVNKPCEKIFSSESAAAESQNILVNPRNVGVETQWYSEQIEEYKLQKEKLMQLRDKEFKDLMQKFEKESIQIKSETEKFIKNKEDEYQKRLAELEKEKRKILEMEEAKEKKILENIQQNKEDAKSIANELKEKMFNEGKKNIACNLEVYLEIIKNKADAFVQETQKLKNIQEEMKDNEKIYNEIEMEIENYNLKKAEVENKIYAFYEIDYNANLEYLSDRFNNLVEIVFRNNEKLCSAEIEEFILNNQLNLSPQNKQKVLSIKQNYEKMILRFSKKLENFKMQAEQSEKLIEKFSNNEKINNILELNTKYEGALNKFVQSYPQETNNNLNFSNNNLNNNNNNNINQIISPPNSDTRNFNFNRKKFDLKNLQNKPTNGNNNTNNNFIKQENKLTKYDETAHTKIFEEIMKEYEEEFNNLNNKYESIKKEIETLHTEKAQANNNNFNNVLTKIPVNAGINFNKSVYSESAIKNLYKNYKENNANCSQDPFSNINLYNELKNNLGKVLQNHIPSVEYIDDSGDDFDEIFNKDKKPDFAAKAGYDPKANSAEFKESKKIEFSNIFGTKQLNEAYQKYKEEFNQIRVIENAQTKANKEFEVKNKNLSAFLNDQKNENKSIKEKENVLINKNIKADFNANNYKSDSSKNLNSSFNSSFNAQGDNNNNSSVLSGNLNSSSFSNKINVPSFNQAIPSEKKPEEPKLIGKSLISEKQPQAAAKPKERESSVESSQENKPSQPKEPFSFKQPSEPAKDEKANKGLLSAAGSSEKSTSLFTGAAVDKNKQAEEAEKPKVYLAQNAGLFKSKPAEANPFQNALNNKKKAENESKPEAEADAASGESLQSKSSEGRLLASSAAAQQQKQEELKNKDVFSNLIPSANNQNSSLVEKSESVNAGANQAQVSSSNFFNPFFSAVQAAKPKIDENKNNEIDKKAAAPHEDKTAPPLDSANVVTSLLNQNLSFSKPPESAENKAKTEVNANIFNKNAPPHSVQSNLNNNNNNAPAANNNLNNNQNNHDNTKKEENKSPAFPVQAQAVSSADNPPVNFANLFKSSASLQPAINQGSGFPGFGKPQQGASEANKPAASLFTNLANQANNAIKAPSTGFAGFGQASALNANQQLQQQSNHFGASAVANSDSNAAIPKFGFGQTSSLGAPIADAAKPPTSTMNIGFGKNLGNAGDLSNQSGFASLASSNNQGGFAGLASNNQSGFAGLASNNQSGFAGLASNNQSGFFGQNQGGFGKNAGGNASFMQNQNQNYQMNVGFNAGFNMNPNNNNQMSTGFNMNAIPNNNGFNNVQNNNANNNNNMFFNQQPQQQQNNMNRQGPGPIKNDYDF